MPIQKFHPRNTISFSSCFGIRVLLTSMHNHKSSIINTCIKISKTNSVRLKLYQPPYVQFYQFKYKSLKSEYKILSIYTEKQFM